LADVHDVALYDLDGVLYLGPDGIPHAAASVQAARERGLRAAFVTNNASRAPRAVAQHLTELGVPASVDDVVTSGQAAARLVAERVRAGSAVLVLGTEALADQVRERGLRPVRTLEQAGPDGPAAVLQGIAPETGWRDLAEACLALRAGALWVAGNLDATLPTSRGQLPGNGAMVAALRTATGLAPLVAGKPEPALHAEAVARTGAVRPLVVGDRLDTDVLGAVTAGAPSLLVLTGVVDVPGLLAAPSGSRPTYVAEDLRALLHPQPEVALDGAVARCGPATARREDDRLVVELADDDVPGRTAALRAVCALVWRDVDGGSTVPEVEGLRLGATAGRGA
jgi:HAD superfamily hydrolase (TIGR01450 family)